MLLNVSVDNPATQTQQETVSTSQNYAIEVPAGFAVEVVDSNGTITIRFNKASKDASDDSTFEIERMIEFGAHSREFIDYAFDCHEEWVIRNNLPKLLKNGLGRYSFLNLEKEAAKGKTPVEVESILDWYVKHLEYLKKDDDIYIADSLIRLLIEMGFDADLEGNWALRLYMSANEKELLDPRSCAEGYFLYRHRDDEDAHYSLIEKELWCLEEVDSIFDAYFSFPVDDEDEEEY